MVGIYKISSPTGKVYIGQSWDIGKRWKAHSSNLGKSKLLNSLRKYGNTNHIFKVVHELPLDVHQNVINNYEQIYMDLYRGINIELLNLREAGSHGTHSEETKKIISETGKGRKISDKHKRILSELHKGNKYNVGKKRTDEHKKKLSIIQIGKVVSEETRRKISDSKKGANSYMYGINSGDHPQAKKIRCINTGIVYATIKDAAFSIGVKRSTLSMCLTGKNKNKTSLVYDYQ